MGEWLTTSGAAKTAGVDPNTIRRWCAQNGLSHSRVHGGHRRIHSDDLDRFLADGKKGKPIDVSNIDVPNRLAEWREMAAEIDDSWDDLGRSKDKLQQAARDILALQATLDRLLVRVEDHVDELR